jgi:hypothetical protein
MPRGIPHHALNWDAAKNEIRDEAFEEAAQSVQRAIDIWKTWDSDEGYEAINTAINTAIGIMDRIRGLKTR